MKMIVIGAGISGLTCAYELQKAGVDVLVLEKEDWVGGRMSSRAKQGFSFDLGAQIVSQSYASVLAYCRELGLKEEWQKLNGLTHYLYHEGKFHNASFNSVREFLSYSYLPPVARLRLLLFITALGLKARNIDFFDLATGTEFDKENAYEFALKWGGQEVADEVVDALVGAYHFHHSRDMSLGAFLGCLNHFSRFFTFHRMIPDMSALPQAFAHQLNVRTGTAVRSAAVDGHGLIVYTDFDKFRCDGLILATPADVTRTFFQTPSSNQKVLLDAVQYASTINVGFLVPTASVQDVSLVVVPETDSKSICSYLLPLKCAGHEEQSDQTPINVFLRDSYAREMLAKSDAEIFEQVKRELIAVCPPLEYYSQQIVPNDLQRWPCAMPKFFPSYISLVKKFWETGQGENRVYFCGDFLNMPWIEGSVRCGQRIAALVTKDSTLI